MPGLELGLELRVEFDQSRVFYKILVYRNDLSLSFPTGVLSLPPTAPFPFFSLASFRAVPKLTEGVEEPRTRTGTQVKRELGLKAGTEPEFEAESEKGLVPGLEP